MKSGTKIWIYEPAFYLPSITKSERITPSSMFFYNFALFLSSKLDRVLSRFHMINTETLDSFTKLLMKARQNGWYLSPKEIPFNVHEFTRQLENRFNVENDYWATIFLIGWSFNINLINNSNMRKVFNILILSILSRVDRHLSKDISFLEQKLIAPSHAFYVWECTI